VSILKVARLGHPVLRTKALPVPAGEIGSPRIQQLIDDMFDTMREYSGIGLAAPQVHESVRVFVAGVRKVEEVGDMTDEGEMPLVALINAELSLVGKSAEEGWEGCLSIPDIRGLVPRAAEIRVRAYDRHGQRIEFIAKGFPARVLQHEQDHVDGILFLDRMRSLGSLTFMDEYQRYWREEEEEEQEIEAP
jgi:peptide deformylase